MIGDEIVQVNLKVVKWGSKPLFVEKEKVEEKEEKKVLFPIKMD